MSGAATFRAMGCDVVVGGASASELGRVRALFAQRERRFSRFLGDSELLRVNAAAGSVVRVSPEFARTLALALAAAEATEGLVDPTLGLALERAGYDRDLAELADGPDDAPPPAPAPGRWQAVRVDGRLVSVPQGVLLDLNGVVKSLCVDDALSLLSAEGFVSAGGDVATRGGCVVGLDDRAAVRLPRGGLATSGTTRGRWLRCGALQHHLIDPGTGVPSRSPWLEVTVAGASCVAADVAAKAAFLLGEAGPEWLDERGLPGRFVMEREPVVNGAWRRALEVAEVAAC